MIFMKIFEMLVLDSLATETKIKKRYRRGNISEMTKITTF